MNILSSSKKIIVCLFLTFFFSFSNGQGIIDKLNKKLNDLSKNILSGFTTKNVSFQSNYSNFTMLLPDTGKYFKIANDLYIDLGSTLSEYPLKYGPSWDMINTTTAIKFNKYNPILKMESERIANLEIKSYDGYAYIFMSNFLGLCCDCGAKLIKTGDKVVLGVTEQIFALSDFYRFEEMSDNNSNRTIRITNQPCKKMSGSLYDQGGWRMKITLSIDNSQALIMSSTVESVVDQPSVIKKSGTDVGNRWTVSNSVFPNKLSASQAIAKNQQKELDDKEMKVRLDNEAKASALKEIENKKIYEEQARLFETKIKNSLINVAKVQSLLSYSSNYSCLNPFQDSYITEDTRVKEKGEMIYTPEGVPVGEREIYVTVPGRTYYRDGTKNTCSSDVKVRGVKKLQSTKGTIYYEDASFIMKPGEFVTVKFEIEENYDAKTAQINSTHYFKNKLLIK